MKKFLTGPVVGMVVVLTVAILAIIVLRDDRPDTKEFPATPPRKNFAYLTTESGLYCPSRFAVLAGGRYEATCHRLPPDQVVLRKEEVPLIEQRDLTVRDEALKRVREADRNLDRLTHGAIVRIEYQGATYYTRDKTGLAFRQVGD